MPGSQGKRGRSMTRTYAYKLQWQPNVERHKARRLA